MSSLNILISGSGIAGTVFAFWLLRAYPTANITIVERSPSLRLTGASVDIRSSAVDIIKWMGLGAEIRKQATNEEGMQLVDENGKPVATMMATGREDVQSLTSEFEIFRGALAQIFIGPIMERAELVFDEYVEGFEQRDDGVKVTFAKSEEVRNYDLLVAADGLGSKLRGLMLDSDPREQIVDSGTHVAYFTIKKDLLQGSRIATGYSTTLGRAVYLRPDPDPAGRTRALLMKVTPKEDVETKEKLDKALREGNETFMKAIEEIFGDMGWITPEVLKEMRKSDDFYCSLFGQVKSPKIHDGRVVLLGDAGYATNGFGTSIAIIGAYVLAGELLSHPGDVKTALRRYEEIVLPFATSQQSNGDGAMQFAHPQTALGIKARNMLFGFVTWARLDRVALTVSAALGLTEKKAPLPDYPWAAE
ncbi:Uncharacterized protein LSUE1_G009394 [Lachnellula suecica]|uniref:FAD-binding domain-containing protein n=1 Tax=Lachnellula suecica TaxID=602035 RepID=A0A8T9C108_9HELO|nr:Uncharacterized protein LSUE1_G009394 [Lachnellula suecica]